LNKLKKYCRLPKVMFDIPIFKNKKLLASVIIIFGLTGFIASFMLTLNKISYLENPDFVPSCNVNPWLDCGIVMKSTWASLFGFPNMIIGLATYPLAVLTGLVVLLNEKNNKWLIRGCLSLALLGLLVNVLLMYTSSFVIGAVCLWCILSITSTTNITFALASYALGTSKLNEGSFLQKYYQNWHFLTLVIFYFAIALMVMLGYFLIGEGVISPENMPNLFFWVPRN
jgi:uncharacterized membrane protein